MDMSEYDWTVVNWFGHNWLNSDIISVFTVHGAVNAQTNDCLTDWRQLELSRDYAWWVKRGIQYTIELSTDKCVW